MAALESTFSYKQLSVLSTNTDIKAIRELITNLAVSPTRFPEYTPGTYNKLCHEDIYKLASILVGRECLNLRFYVPKDLSKSTILDALNIIHAIRICLQTTPRLPGVSLPSLALGFNRPLLPSSGVSIAYFKKQANISY